MLYLMQAELPMRILIEGEQRAQVVDMAPHASVYACVRTRWKERVGRTGEESIHGKPVSQGQVNLRVCGLDR